MLSDNLFYSLGIAGAPHQPLIQGFLQCVFPCRAFCFELFSPSPLDILVLVYMFLEKVWLLRTLSPLLEVGVVVFWNQIISQTTSFYRDQLNTTGPVVQRLDNPMDKSLSSG